MGLLLLAVRPSTMSGQRPALRRAEQEIRAARARSNRGIAAHDTAAIAAEWADDIHLVSSVSQQVAGRAANALAFARQFAERPDVIYVRAPDSVRVWLPWGMAAEYGRWRGKWTSAGRTIEIGGPYFAKWQTTGGRWLIVAEIYSPGWCRGGAYCESRP
jgi:ketosteroid isomerase-like protein